MKRGLILAALVLLVVPLRGMCSDANRMHYVELLPLQTGLDITGGHHDIAAYKGNATFVFYAGATTITNYAATLQIETCATSNGTFSVVTNLAGTVVKSTLAGAQTVADLTTVPCDLSRFSKYIRVTVDQANATNEVGALMVAPMKSE